MEEAQSWFMVSELWGPWREIALPNGYTTDYKTDAVVLTMWGSCGDLIRVPQGPAKRLWEQLPWSITSELCDVD